MARAARYVRREVESVRQPTHARRIYQACRVFGAKSPENTKVTIAEPIAGVGSDFSGSWKISFAVRLLTYISGGVTRTALNS